MGLKRMTIAGLATLGAASTLAVDRSEQRPLVDGTMSALPQPAKPLVDSEALEASISADALLSRAKLLFEIAQLSQDEYGHPTRVIGSAGHRGTLKYIQQTLAALGDYYTLSTQPFPAVSGVVFESRLLIGSALADSAAPMSLTPPTRHGKQPVDGRLVLVANDGCSAADYPPPTAAKGPWIAMIRRGTCPFGTKSAHAGRAGAAAAVVFNYEDSPVAGTLGTPSPHHVATFGLSGAEAAPVVARLRAGEAVAASAYIDANVTTITTANVVAQTRSGDPDNCVMLGGHSDSVAEGPGINDDGSGSLALLEVATQLANFSVNNCVRFAWWSGEEEGLLGSDYYVETLPAEENRRIRLFMDYDMLASPNFAYQVYDARDAVNPAGSQQLRDLYVDWYVRQGLNYTFIPFDGRSDYDGFIRNGIPGGGIATGAEGIKSKQEAALFGGEDGVAYDVCYHAICDTVANLNLTAWELNTKVCKMAQLGPSSRGVG